MSAQPTSPVNRKLGRNDLCWCGSGRKYKYCHLDADRDRLVILTPGLHPPGTPTQVNYKDDFANLMARFSGPLMRFCSDNDFFLFGSTLTVGDMEDAHKLLNQGTLTTQYLINAYKKLARLEPLSKLITHACSSYMSFSGRDSILHDAIEAHFDKKYTLSIPVLFAQLEGVLRSVGALEYKDTFRPTIKKDIWDNRLLFDMRDRAQFFNAYISKIYEGQKNISFNRNAVLHGERVDYATEDNSLILILCILEVRSFLWFENKTQIVV